LNVLHGQQGSFERGRPLQTKWSILNEPFLHPDPRTALTQQHPQYPTEPTYPRQCLLLV